jgi:3-oxoacyl-[acyl-carrier-protein] synthase III
MGSAITGWGAALPERVLDNVELAAGLEVDDDWIRARTGIESRHIAGKSDTASSLATVAGAAALDRAGLEPQDIDTVIVATSTPDTPMPASAPLVQSALGIPQAAAFDLNAACSGFLYGLAQAHALISADMSRRTLLCGADLLSRLSDYSDVRSCVLFGDGAGAVVVERVEGPTRLGPFKLLSDGTRAPLLHVPVGDRFIRMQGREVYRHAVEGMTKVVQEVLADASLGVSDIDLLVAHQANARIIEAVAARLELTPSQAFLNIVRLGNTSAASIPLALVEAVETGRLEDDDVLIVTAFGAGFVWGAGAVRWGVRAREPETLVLAGDARV